MGEGTESGRLGRWILIPLFLLIVVFVIAFLSSLPHGSCDVADGPTHGGGRGLNALIFLCSVGVAGAALVRLVEMWKLDAFEQRDGFRVLGALILLALLTGVFGGDSLLGRVLAAGSVVALPCLLVLAVAGWSRREVDEVGIVLPLYLLALALCAYPGLGYMAAHSNAGALC
ncbi:MAG: hypothetical protein ACTHO8_09235 [Solirubrobacterales bacterium]